MERELKPKKGRFQVSAKEERTSHGIVFASKLELRLFLWLKKRLPDEPIRLQEKFILQEGFRGPHENRHRPILYVTDFTLGPKRSSADAPVPVGMLVIDAKGMETTDFRMKRKMFEYRYGVPLWTPGSEGQLEVIIQHYKNIMKNKQVLEALSGSQFAVTGYVESDGRKTNRTFRRMPMGGYEILLEESLAMLEDRAGAATIVQVLKDAGTPRDVAAKAMIEVHASTQKSLDPDKASKPWSGGKEELVPVEQGISFVKAEPDKVVVTNLEQLSCEEIEPPTKVTKSKELTLAKNAILAQLPRGRFVSRINLYPGKYDTVTKA